MFARVEFWYLWLDFTMPKFSNQLAFKALKNFGTAILLTISSVVGNLLADGWSTPAEEKAIARAQRAWEDVMPHPDQIDAQIVLYKYRDNYSVRCRTEATIFPVGSYPGAGACVDLGNARSEARDAHLLGRCWDITKGNIDIGSSQEAAWINAGIIASTSCPIRRDSTPWGYVAINFQGASFNSRNLVKPGFESFPAETKGERIYLVQKFQEAAEIAMNKGAW
jgi:hypothetical protein